MGISTSFPRASTPEERGSNGVDVIVFIPTREYAREDVERAIADAGTLLAAARSLIEDRSGATSPDSAD